MESTQFFGDLLAPKIVAHSPCHDPLKSLPLEGDCHDRSDGEAMLYFQGVVRLGPITNHSVEVNKQGGLHGGWCCPRFEPRRRLP